MCSTTSGRLRELINKVKDQLVIPESGRGRLRMPGVVAYKSFQFTEFEWQFKRGFTKLVVIHVTRAWSLMRVVAMRASTVLACVHEAGGFLPTGRRLN